MTNNNTWHAKAPIWVTKLLKHHKSGTVSMKNSKGIYISVGGEMLLVCDSKWGTVPCGISVEKYEDLLKTYTIYENMPVTFSNSTISFLSENIHFDLTPVESDYSLIVPCKENFDYSLSILKKTAKPSGLARLGEVIFDNKAVVDNPWSKRALPKLKKLITAFIEDDANGIYHSANSLLGLGPGLTPSGDDILAGVYYGLSHSALFTLESVSALRRVIANADKKTTPVSVSFLRAISNAAPFDILGNAWRDSYYTRKLVEIGNHSGTEMLLGLLCAMSIIFSKSHHKQDEKNNKQ